MNTKQALAAVLLLMLGVLHPIRADEIAELDAIVAIVNEDVITRSELDQEIATILVQLRARGTELPPREAIEHQVLERMISKRLELQTAERLGLQVDDATLERAIDSIAAKNNLSVPQLRETLEKEGVDFARFRQDTRNQILIARLQAQEVVNRITVTDQEVRSFLEHGHGKLADRTEVRLQHILVVTPDGATPEVIQRAREKIDRIMEELRGGADFAKVALLQSDGRQALEGGDLGWMKLSDVPTIAAEAARTLQPGQLTDPIRSASGFHIFRLAQIRGGERQVVTQIHARHILIKTSELVSDQDAQTRLAQLRIRLLGGEDFGALAQAHSDDTASAIKGGDLGWLSPGDTVPVFEDQLKKLAPGEISRPFRTPFGWHLVQVLGRRQHDNTADMLRAQARESIRARKAQEAIDLWLQRLRDEAYVEIRLDHKTG
jgi:peptidyl-prolyl cis-trans isomerase SurA